MRSKTSEQKVNSNLDYVRIWCSNCFASATKCIGSIVTQSNVKPKISESIFIRHYWTHVWLPKLHQKNSINIRFKQNLAVSTWIFFFDFLMTLQIKMSMNQNVSCTWQRSTKAFELLQIVHLLNLFNHHFICQTFTGTNASEAWGIQICKSY